MGLAIRVGVHTGEVAFVGGNVRGLAVHAAARVMSLAGADQVLVSSTTADLLEGSGVRLDDLGAHELKGLSGTRRVFRVVERQGISIDPSSRVPEVATSIEGPATAGPISQLRV
jgi:class 3 adenylate cyclase